MSALTAASSLPWLANSARTAPEEATTNLVVDELSSEVASAVAGSASINAPRIPAIARRLRTARSLPAATSCRQAAKIASGRSALTMYWPASTISEILRSTARLHRT